MLQPKALLSENTLLIMRNNQLERPCSLNVGALRVFNAIGPSFSSQVYKNVTVH